MIKSLATLVLLLVPCLLLSACGKVADAPTTTTITTVAPPAPLPAEERYTDEVGRYISKNVAINAEMEQYFVPYNSISSNGCATGQGYTSINCFIKDFEESTVAVVKKTASESYYTAYDDGRTPLAYTLSTIEIVSLPEGAVNYHNLQVGDSITIAEAYAFAPDAPDVIYRSHIIPRNSDQWGLMEFGNTYLVNITNLLAIVQCNETGKEESETIELPDDCYIVAADIYPIDQEIYKAWLNDSAVGDLAIPTAYPEQSLQHWSTIYQWAYEQYVTD